MSEEELLKKYGCNNLGIFIDQYLTCQLAYDLLKTQFKEIERLNDIISKAAKYIEDNFANIDGTIWHEEIKKVYNKLKGVEKE